MGVDAPPDVEKGALPPREEEGRQAHPVTCTLQVQDLGLCPRGSQEPFEDFP